MCVGDLLEGGHAGWAGARGSCEFNFNDAVSGCEMQEEQVKAGGRAGGQPRKAGDVGVFV